jgi:hypothetical protein
VQLRARPVRFRKPTPATTSVSEVPTNGNRPIPRRMTENGGNGLAVRSTFRRMVQSFDGTEEVIHIGETIYRDPRDRSRPENFGNTLAPVMRKRPSSDFERELRAVAAKVPTKWKCGSPPYEQLKDIHPKGFGVAVNLDSPIEGIYVAPGRPSWFKDLIAKLLNRYAFDVSLETSSIDRRPEPI